MVSAKGKVMYEILRSHSWQSNVILGNHLGVRQERNMQWLDGTSSSTDLLKEKIRFFGDLTGFNRLFVL